MKKYVGKLILIMMITCMSMTLMFVGVGCVTWHGVDDVYTTGDTAPHVGQVIRVIGVVEGPEYDAVVWVPAKGGDIRIINTHGFHYYGLNTDKKNAWYIVEHDAEVGIQFRELESK